MEKNFSHSEMVSIAYKWAMKRCGVAFVEFYSANNEIPDVIGFRTDESLLVEVKVSRSDFLFDKRKKHQEQKGMGKYRFYMCPKGLIKKEELPEKWGLIYVNSKGKTRMIFNPYCKSQTGNIWSGGFEQDLPAENRLMYSALRRLQIRGRIPEIYTPK